MKDYQLNYASTKSQMYDYTSRSRKAIRITKTLSDFLEPKKISQSIVLDIGCSTGIIDSILATKFKKVIGTDIDQGAIKFAKQKFQKQSNLSFQYADALNLKFKSNSFDIVICTHVYEHVPNPTKVMTEIHRVLKKDGVCYFAAINKLWPIEPHYNLPFLAYLPKKLANQYVKITNKADRYYETPFSYWQLQKLVRKFTIHEYTQKILTNPERFGYGDILNTTARRFMGIVLAPFAKYLAPTFFGYWLKRNNYISEFNWLTCFSKS